jgi:hypothetical protein
MQKIYKIVPLRWYSGTEGKFALVINDHFEFEGTEKECLDKAISILGKRK